MKTTDADLQAAIAKAKLAYNGDSNDEEHDALFELLKALDGYQPEKIKPTLLLYQSENPRGITVDAEIERSGDEYTEACIACYDEQGKRIADVFVGLCKDGIDDESEVRVLVTADGDGDGDHAIAIYPERAASEAYFKFNQRS